MISINRYLEQQPNGAEADARVFEASLQMCRLLLDGIATHLIRGREADWKTLGRTVRGLLRRMDDPPTALGLLGIGSEAVEAFEAYAQSTERYQSEEHEQMQTVVAMLTDTVADLSGQTDASVARLQTIERQIEQASGLDDIRTLSANLESCLVAVREAAAGQRSGSAATVRRLQDHISNAQSRAVQNRTAPPLSKAEIDMVAEPSDDGLPARGSTRYVAVFKLQRAEHIATRFGESARHQMLTLVGQSLKTVLEPDDRLLRWKGTSFVMFLQSTSSMQEIRSRLSDAVAATGRQYIEVGRKSALLSVGVDWMVFPETQCASLDAVFAEVDAFLSTERLAGSRGGPKVVMEGIGI
jgi:GGDEF domain-containing protein